MTDWGRLGSYIRSELRRRGWTQADLAEAAGVDPRTVSRLLSETVEHKRLPDSIPNIERALGWEPNTARGVLAGGTPDGYAVPAERRMHFDDPDEQTIWDAGERNGWPVDKRQYLIDSLRALKRAQRGA